MCDREPVHARTLPVNSIVQGVWRQAASLVPRYRDRGAGRPPDRLPERSCQVRCTPLPAYPGTHPRIWHNLAVPQMHAMTKKPRPYPVDALHRDRAGPHIKDPGRVRRSPPWARPRRGLKIHAVLLYYVCTGQCCPLQRGQCWPILPGVS